MAYSEVRLSDRAEVCLAFGMSCGVWVFYTICGSSVTHFIMKRLPHGEVVVGGAVLGIIRAGACGGLLGRDGGLLRKGDSSGIGLCCWCLLRASVGGIYAHREVQPARLSLRSGFYYREYALRRFVLYRVPPIRHLRARQ